MPRVTSKIEIIDSDENLTTQQKRAYKLGVLLKAKSFKSWSNNSLIISVITFVLSLFVWWPFLILSLLTILLCLSWRLRFKELLGDEPNAAFDVASWQFGGEEAINRENFWAELAKVSGVSKEGQDFFENLKELKR